ncbi:MAG: helix-turn-helix domain-containing protein [Faecalibacterium prausnitzii]
MRSQLAFALLCELSRRRLRRPCPAPLVAAAIEDIRRNYAGLYGVEEPERAAGRLQEPPRPGLYGALGVSPGRYLTSVRIEAAMRLLLHREYTLDVIASLCGFSGANYLCRVFKKTTGQSPTQWRAMAGRSALSELSPEQQRLEQELFI